MNRIIEANNVIVVASNYHLCPLTKDTIDSLLAVSVTNSGLLQIELEYGTGRQIKFDFTDVNKDMECLHNDKFLLKKGDKFPLELHCS